MHPIYEDEQVFHSQYHYFCEKNSVYHLLRHGGWDDDYINSILNLNFSLNLQIKNHQFFINQKSATEPFSVNEICAFRQRENFYTSLRQCHNQIISGIPIIASADTYYLPYRIEFKRNHACHSVIIADITETHIYLIDWYPPHFFKGAISLEQWKDAWSSENPGDNNPFSGYPISNEWFTVDLSLCKKYTSELRIKNLTSIISSLDTINSIKLLIKILSYNKSKLKKEHMILFHDAFYLHYRSALQASSFINSLNEIKGDMEKNKAIMLLQDITLVLEGVNNQFLLASAGETERRISRIIDYLNVYSINRKDLTKILSKSMEDVKNG